MYPPLSAVSDTAIIVYFSQRTTPPVVFGKNCELRHFGVGEDRHFLIAPRRRPAWFAGTLIGILLLGLLGWMSARDADATREAAREAAIQKAAMQQATRRGYPIISHQYYDADIACLTTFAPSPTMVFFSAQQADGKKPRFGCEFVGIVAGKP